MKNDFHSLVREWIACEQKVKKNSPSSFLFFILRRFIFLLDTFGIPLVQCLAHAPQVDVQFVYNMKVPVWELQFSMRLVFLSEVRNVPKCIYERKCNTYNLLSTFSMLFWMRVVTIWWMVSSQACQKTHLWHSALGTAHAVSFVPFIKTGSSLSLLQRNMSRRCHCCFHHY